MTQPVPPKDDSILNGALRDLDAKRQQALLDAERAKMPPDPDRELERLFAEFALRMKELDRPICEFHSEAIRAVRSSFIGRLLGESASEPRYDTEILARGWALPLQGRQVIIEPSYESTSYFRDAVKGWHLLAISTTAEPWLVLMDPRNKKLYVRMDSAVDKTLLGKPLGQSLRLAVINAGFGPADGQEQLPRRIAEAMAKLIRNSLTPADPPLY